MTLEPLIAVAGCVVDPGKIDGWADEAVAIPARYLHALLRAGGNAAVIMPAPVTEEEADDMLDHFDGVLLAGGGDLDPAHYDQDPHDSVYGVDTQRDDFELELARALVRRHIPTLAICRGAQVLNVALGGTLDQHITDRPSPVSHGIPGKLDGANVHSVSLTAGSRIADAMGATRVECSCHHHQAIDQVGEGLEVVARADDGVIEAVELDDAAWIVAAQWHPEDTSATDPAQHGLFATFVQHAIAAAGTNAALRSGPSNSCLAGNGRLHGLLDPGEARVHASAMRRAVSIRSVVRVRVGCALVRVAGECRSRRDDQDQAHTGIAGQARIEHEAPGRAEEDLLYQDAQRHRARGQELLSFGSQFARAQDQVVHRFQNGKNITESVDEYSGHEFTPPPGKIKKFRVIVKATSADAVGCVWIKLSDPDVGPTKEVQVRVNTDVCP